MIQYNICYNVSINAYTVLKAMSMVAAFQMVLTYNNDIINAGNVADTYFLSIIYSLIIRMSSTCRI